VPRGDLEPPPRDPIPAFCAPPHFPVRPHGSRCTACSALTSHPPRYLHPPARSPRRGRSTARAATATTHAVYVRKACALPAPPCPDPSHIHTPTHCGPRAKGPRGLPLQAEGEPRKARQPGQPWTARDYAATRSAGHRHRPCCSAQARRAAGPERVCPSTICDMRAHSPIA
jgi:hypothetical protein